MSLQINFKRLIPRLEILAKKNSPEIIKSSYKSAFKGEGSDFFQYSEYISGDNSKKIDWKASLRAQKLLKKEFVEERNVNVFFLLEVSTKMLTGTANLLKAEYSAELANILITLAYQAGDNVGYALFNNGVSHFQKPGASHHVLYYFRRDVINTANYRKGADLAASLRFLMSHLNNGSILFIFSDFLNLSELDHKLLRIAMNKYDVIGIAIRDPIDFELPFYDGNIVLESFADQSQVICNPLIAADEYKANALQDFKLIAKLFRNNGADISLFFTDENYVPQIIKMFQRRNMNIGTG